VQRRQLARLAVVAVTTPLLAACSTVFPSSRLPHTPSPTPPVATWRVELVAAAEGTTLDAVVHDETGLVREVQPGQPVREGISSQSLAAQLASGSTRDLIVSWSTSRCATSSQLSFRNAENVLLITLAPLRPVDCDPIAVTYGIAVSLAEALAIRDVVVTDDAPTGRAWGMMVLGSDGRSRPVLVLDQTRASVLVAPLSPPEVPHVATGAAAMLDGSGTSATLGWASRNCDDVMNVTANREERGLSLIVELTQSAGSQPCAATHTQGIAIRSSPDARWESVQAGLAR
jgi:hypothetical protein